jgi:hypothetical protein
MTDDITMLKSQAKAWNAIFKTLTDIDPTWWDREGNAIQNATDFIKHMAKTATPFPKEPEILDRDAAWKIVGVPLKTVISYLQSLPEDAKIVQQDNEHLELIVIK